MRRVPAAALVAILLVGLLPFHVLAGATPQTITFDPLPGRTYGDPDFTVSATSDSGLTVEFASLTSPVCTVTGTTVSLVTPGTCTIEATQPGDATYDVATPVDQGFLVGKATLTVTASSPADGVYGDATPAVSPLYSGFVGTDDATAVDTAPDCVTAYAQGDVPAAYGTSCSGGSSAKYDLSFVAGSFTVGMAPLTVTASSPSGAFGDPVPTITPGYSAFVLGQGAGDLATAPTCSTTYLQGDAPGSYPTSCSGGVSGNYAFDYVDGTFSVGQAGQTISFTSTAPTGAVVGGPTYDVAATATSGLAVTFTIDAASSAVCTLNGTPSTVSFTAVGACTIDADQGGDPSWSAAPQAQQTVDVGDQAPTCPDAAASVVMNVAKTGAAGCTDPESDPLTYAIVADGAHGTASIDTAGTWTYTPAANYVGPDTFTLRANDGTLDSSVATITVTVADHQDDARNDAFSVPPLARTTIDVLANDIAGAGDTGQPLSITGVTQGTKGRVTTDGATVGYDPTGCATGTDLFTYSITDGRTTDTATVIVTILRPGQGGLALTPLTDTPALSFAVGSTMSTTVPMRLSWCGVVASGAPAYTVRQGSDGISFPATVIGSTTATSSIRSLAVGTRYAWAVRTADSAHRTSPYAPSAVYRLGRLQDSSTAIHYSSGWHVARSSSYSGGTEHYATSTGASATVTLTNVRGFAIVSSKGIGRGSLRVWVDGVLVATISERSSTVQERRVIYARSLSAGVGVKHTIVIRPYGNGRVDIDALLALS